MSEYAVRQLRPIQALMDSTPADAPTYDQALFLAAMEYIVLAQEKYYKFDHNQRRALASHGTKEYHCNDLNRMSSFNFNDGSTAYYEKRLGFNMQYSDIFTSVQGPRWKPGVEKTGK